ncbi:MAG: phosphotransferase, partial [Desulfobacterales bacterium]|nr:phosphotransferase [Desulfobacterales bacterium]
TPREKIRFEHGLLGALKRRDFPLTPFPVETVNGGTYVHREVAGRRVYISVFHFLRGEDKYAWNVPGCTMAELRDAARGLALYHNAIAGWEGADFWSGAGFIEQLPGIDKKWRDYARGRDTSPFAACFSRHFHELREEIEWILNSPIRGAYPLLPRLAIHGDYHPGNLKFRDGKMTGMLDFDWSRMDPRCLDLGQAIVYFCARWEKSAAAPLSIRGMDAFLEAYQRGAEETAGVGPLTARERESLPAMTSLGVLALIDWAADEYFNALPDSPNCLGYLRHGVRLLRWLRAEFRVLSSEPGVGFGLLGG